MSLPARFFALAERHPPLWYLAAAATLLALSAVAVAAVLFMVGTFWQ